MFFNFFINLFIDLFIHVFIFICDLIHIIFKDPNSYQDSFSSYLPFLFLFFFFSFSLFLFPVIFFLFILATNESFITIDVQNWNYPPTVPTLTQLVTVDKKPVLINLEFEDESAYVGLYITSLPTKGDT